MIKGPLKITIEGKAGVEKTQLLNLILNMLHRMGYTNTIINDENHTIELQKGE